MAISDDDLYRGHIFQDAEEDSQWEMQSEPESVQNLFYAEASTPRPSMLPLIASPETTPSTGLSSPSIADDGGPSFSGKKRFRITGVKEAKGWSEKRVPDLPMFRGDRTVDEAELESMLPLDPDDVEEDETNADRKGSEHRDVERKAKDLARQEWVSEWIRDKDNERGFFKTYTSYNQKRTLARCAWSRLTEEEKRGFVDLTMSRHPHLEKGRGMPPLPKPRIDPRVKGHYGTHHKVYGLLCTYNYTFPECEGLDHVFETLKTKHPESDDFANAVAVFKMHPVVIQEWQKWLAELQDLLETTSGIGETSACAEISVKSLVIRVHYHTFNSSLGLKNGESIERLGWDEWKIFDRAPDMQRSGGRGRYIVTAIQRGHTYCQANKIGHLFTYTNFPMHEAFSVNPKWLMDLWRDRKMSTKEVERALIASRGDGLERHFQRLAFWQEKADNQKIRELQLHVKEGLKVGMLPFKRFPEISEWAKQYAPSNYGKLRRFKFLVLEGPTSLGKTVLGMNLFQNTFYVNMQCSPEPNIMKFKYGEHDSILLDEICWEKVISHKVFFQAGVEGTYLSESVCMQHAYWRWLYATPLILCTNRWIPRQRSVAKDLSGAHPGQPVGHDDGGSESEEVPHGSRRLCAGDRDWLEKNSVHVRINDIVWEAETSLLW